MLSCICYGEMFVCGSPVVAYTSAGLPLRQENNTNKVGHFLS